MNNSYSVSSQNSFSHELQHEVLVHKALTHPVRLRIVRTLFRFCEMTLQDLSQELDISAATLFRHLRNLETAGILTTRHKENSLYYHLQKF